MKEQDEHSGSISPVAPQVIPYPEKGRVYVCSQLWGPVFSPDLHSLLAAPREISYWLLSQIQSNPAKESRSERQGKGFTLSQHCAHQRGRTLHIKGKEQPFYMHTNNWDQHLSNM